MKDAVAAGNGAEAYAAACAACRLMDKAASKGVIHKNQAANRKSGIMALANTVATDADRAAYVKPAKKEQKTGSKKAERKAARLAEMKAASEEKAKRREKQLKEEAAAQKRKGQGSRRGRQGRGCRRRRGSCRRITIHAHTALALRSVRISRAKEPRKSGAPSR